MIDKEILGNQSHQKEEGCNDVVTEEATLLISNEAKEETKGPSEKISP